MRSADIVGIGENMTNCIVKFRGKGELEVNNCSLEYGSNAIVLKGTQETFIIPYTSIKYIRRDNETNI